MTFRWYVASTKPNSESKAQRELDRQGFHSYVPRNRVRQVTRGRVGEISEPLFRGYVFIALDLDGETEKWKAVNSTRAVMTLLPSGEHPLPILDADIDGLKRAESSGFFRSGMVVPGEKLRVFRGTLVGRVLECISSSADRVQALWDCFGQRVVVSVGLQDVLVMR